MGPTHPLVHYYQYPLVGTLVDFSMHVYRYEGIYANNIYVGTYVCDVCICEGSYVILYYRSGSVQISVRIFIWIQTQIEK